jgi:hypothetical protein
MIEQNFSMTITHDVKGDANESRDQQLMGCRKCLPICQSSLTVGYPLSTALAKHAVGLDIRALQQNTTCA